MPKFLEDKLRAEAAAKGKTGRQADRYVFGAMQNMGVMRGNKETAKGARMDAKHAKDMGYGAVHPGKNLKGFLHPKRGSLAAHAVKYGSKSSR